MIENQREKKNNENKKSIKMKEEEGKKKSRALFVRCGIHTPLILLYQKQRMRDVFLVCCRGIACADVNNRIEWK